MLWEIHFLSAAQLTECYLIHSKPVSLFITPDKDKVRKESSLGKHQRTVFVLIIWIIFHVQYREKEKDAVNADITNYDCKEAE